MSGTCFLCLSKADRTCDNCPTKFCCLEHKDLHFDSRNQSCYPYKVVEKEGVGRCLVASRRIEPEELIFREVPVTVGPLHETPPICLTCWIPLKNAEKIEECEQCGVPMCGQICSENHIHKNYECKIFEREKLPKNLTANLDDPHPFYQCITPLRCVLLKENVPSKWRAIEAMIDHCQEQSETQPEHWMANQNNIVRYLRERWNISSKATESDINHVIGSLDVNAFEISNGASGGSGRGAFPLTALMSHSCISNARYTVFHTQKPSSNKSTKIEDEGEDTTFRIECRANVAIGVGEEITDFYVPPTYGTMARRNYLKNGWYFDCSCLRCRDATECGTFMTAFNCDKCKGGIILPQDSLDHETEYACQKCQRVVEGPKISALEYAFNSRLDSTDKNDCSELENILGEMLHERNFLDSHYLVLTAKRYLVYVYGRIKGFTYPQLSEERLKKKISYCNELMKVYDVILPGFTKERGLTLFELRTAKLVAQRQNKSRELAQQESQENDYRMLKEVVNCLRNESSGSFEEIVFQAALKQLSGYKELMKLGLLDKPHEAHK